MSRLITGYQEGKSNSVPSPQNESFFYQIRWQIFLPFPPSRHVGLDRSSHSGQKSHASLWRDKSNILDVFSLVLKVRERIMFATDEGEEEFLNSVLVY